MSDPLSREQEIWQNAPWISTEDRDFLHGMFERFPRVRDGFKIFAATPPLKRVPLALQTLETQPRSGWLRFDIKPGHRDILSTHGGEYYGDRVFLIEEVSPVIETVLEHEAEAAELAMLLFPNDPALQWLVEVLKFHDSAEAVITDFMPHDKLTKDEKKRLELLGLDLMTESRKQGDLLATHIYNCIHLYESEVGDFTVLRNEMNSTIEGQAERGEIKPFHRPFIAFASKLYNAHSPDLALLAKRAKDVDCLQMILRGTRILREKHSRLSQAEAHEKMNEFWVYIDKKLTCPETRDFFDIYKQAFHQWDDGSSKNLLSIATLIYNEERGLQPKGITNKKSLGAQPHTP